jgi:hypothetical protein
MELGRWGCEVVGLCCPSSFFLLPVRVLEVCIALWRRLRGREKEHVFLIYYYYVLLFVARRLPLLRAMSEVSIYSVRY